MTRTKSRLGLTLGVLLAFGSPPTLWGADDYALSVHLQRPGPARSHRYFVSVQARPGVDTVLIRVDEETVLKDTERPFAGSISIPDTGEPRWLTIFGLDSHGVERSWIGALVHAPIDLPSVLALETRDRRLVGFVHPGRGRAVERAELIDAGGVLSILSAPPWAFDLSALSPRSSLPVIGLRFVFDDGLSSEAWRGELDPESGGEVRVGSIRLLVRDESDTPTIERTEVSWRGEAQRILAFRGGPLAPLELGIAVDTSRSMAPLLGDLRGAAVRIAERILREGDRAFVVGFDLEPVLLASSEHDPSRALAAIPAEVTGDRTALYDSLQWIFFQFHQTYPRAALLLVSDGCDGSKRAVRPGKALGAARDRSIPVFLVRSDGLCPVPEICDRGIELSKCRGDRLATLFERAQLEAAVTSTGGRTWEIGPEADLGEVLAEIEAILRRQWLVLFEPASDAVRSSEVEVRLDPR